MILVSSAAFFWRFQSLETTPTNTCITKPYSFIQGIKKIIKSHDFIMY